MASEYKINDFKMIVGNVIELSAAVGGIIIIITTSFKSDPILWQFLFNNFLGSVLIGLSVYFYLKELKRRVRAELIHGAFTAITEIQKREAEQLVNMDGDNKTKFLIDSLDKTPDRVFQLLKDLLEEKI